MGGKVNTVAALAAAFFVAIAVSSQVYVAYKILTKKEAPVAVEDALENMALYEGKRASVSGYVVKYRGNETVYVLQSQQSLREQRQDGLLLSEGNYDPYAAYVWSGSYRTIHAAKTAVKGRIVNGTIEVQEAEILD